MLTNNTIEFCLLEDVASARDFLRSHFNCSSNLLKKYFDRSFLDRSFRARSILKLPLNFVNHGIINPQYEGREIPILFEDEFFLVMDKPENLHVHPLVYDEKNNCLSFLRTLRPDLLLVNREQYDRGLLYRLDYGTSGVLVYVKKDVLYSELRKNFSSIAKKKTYLCRVEGNCQLRGKFAHFFSSKEEKGKRVVVSDSEGSGSEGSLIIVSGEYDEKNDSSLLEIELKTGLRHQIRAQMAHLGHAIIGDIFYGGRVSDRLYLHAYQYLISTNWQDYVFESKPHNFFTL